MAIPPHSWQQKQGDKFKTTIEVFTPQFMHDHRCCIYSDMFKSAIKKLNGGKIKEGRYVIEIFHEPNILKPKETTDEAKESV